MEILLKDTVRVDDAEARAVISASVIIPEYAEYPKYVYGISVTVTVRNMFCNNCEVSLFESRPLVKECFLARASEYLLINNCPRDEYCFISDIVPRWKIMLLK